MEYGRVLGASTGATLPATAAYVFFPSLQAAELTAVVLVIAGVWAASYVGINKVHGLLKK